MSGSVLTNTSAMVALQNLRSTNKNLAQVNNQISTGKKVATAKDSSAVFAISKVMESDVAGFKALGESISLGEATVSVASNAAKSIGDLLNEIKGKIVSANNENLDRSTLQDEIVSLREQITTVVDSAQFNGLNLIDGSQTTFNVLSSLNRAPDGQVTSGQVSLNTSNSNLSATTGLGLDDLNGGGSAIAITNNSAGTDQSGTAGGFNNTGFQVVASTAALTLTVAAPLNNGTLSGAVAFDDATAAQLALQTGFIEGDYLELQVGSVTATYTVRENDSQDNIAAGLRTALIDAGIDTSVFDVAIAAGASALTITNNGPLETRVDFNATRGSGGLASLQSINVSTAGGASTALGTIESLIQNATSAQAALGTVEKRLGIQNEFTKTLVDSFKSGIGALVDADLEEASARLQALQVQQQLGVQALSIANQGAQNILALFR